ncbi:MAG: sigma-54-dependent transcriptional regulator [Planctomycetota bacterium]
MRRAPRILLVDDDRLIRLPVRERLEEDGYRVTEATNAAEGRKKLAQGADLVLLDVGLPDADGLTLLGEFREADPDVIVIMLTGDVSAGTAVQAMRAGAFHYCTKPVDVEELAILVANALETTRLRREVRALRGRDASLTGSAAIIGDAPATHALRQLLEKIAASPASTVLITGETGTGKDLAARVVHACSDRSSAPFMSIMCTAVPDALFESEMFGHERGAFTDAREQRKGLIELADGGTVFLDEIGDLPLLLQAKLLRFLEEKTIRRVGGGSDIRVDVRVVAATNRELPALVKAGTFREDLYYRLRVLPVELPALRTRTGDAAILAQHFADIYSRQFHKPISEITSDALQKLATSPWPGNVRELRNTVERAVLLNESGKLEPGDFMLMREGGATEDAVGGEFRLPNGGINLEDVERSLVMQALERTRGNQTRAAALLGLNRDQIRYRVQKFELDMSAFGTSGE